MESIDWERIQKACEEITYVFGEAVGEAAEALARQFWFLGESLEDMQEMAEVYDKPRRKRKILPVNAKIKPLLLDKRSKLHRCRNNC